MEVHVEPPPPGGPPDAPGAKQTFANPHQYMQPQPLVPASQPTVPIQKHPHFPIPPSPRNVPLTRSTSAHPDDRRPKAKLRFPDVTGIQPPPVRVVSKPKAKAEPVVIQPPAPVALPGQGLKEKGPPIDPDIEPANEPGSSSAGPPAIPGLPVTEGEFPIVPQSPAPHDAVPIPESGSESDSDRTVDYRDDPATLLALVESSDDVLLQLPDDFYVPDFVPLDGDGFASWLTRQDKMKAGSVTPEMARRYAKEIRMAKLDEFKSYLDNGALRLADKRKLSPDVNFLTGRWVLTVKDNSGNRNLESAPLTLPHPRTNLRHGSRRPVRPITCASAYWTRPITLANSRCAGALLNQGPQDLHNFGGATLLVSDQNFTLMRPATVNLHS